MRLRPAVSLVGATLAVVVLAGPSAVAQTAATVSVQDNSYSPPSISVAIGGTVTWQWTGSSIHTVTARDGSFDSNERTNGAQFSHTFEAAGTIAYYCRIHGDSMAGVVDVRAASPTPRPTTAAPRPKSSPTAKSPTPAASSPAPLPSPTSAAPSATLSPTPTPSPTPVVAPAPSAVPDLPDISPSATVSRSPSRSAAPLVTLDEPLPEDRTGLAIALGLVVAAAGFGAAGFVLLRHRTPRRDPPIT
ncbi:MAG TPA: plastocyanin/azurin family copper-binding protein [Mycobacteriales bacterium]|nr:plastocyanin/azurin family copper-binding protein [Mycobacteriales bacterium]